MKRELSPVATASLVIAVVAVVGVLGFFWFRNATGETPEDPALAQKQLEVERGMRPGGNPSAGSNSEWEARQKR